MSIEQITVEIFNRQFTIGAPDNERATLLKAVDLLNQKIQTIHQAGQSMETEKVVIMAALNLSHDLLKIANKYEQEALPSQEYERKIQSLIKLCNETLSKS